MRGIRKSITGLIIMGIGLSSILIPIIVTLDNPEMDTNDDDYNLNENLNDEEPQPIKDDGGSGKDDGGPGKDDGGPGKDEDPEPKVISATIDFCPKTLNPKSKGKWVTVYIELEEGYDEIDIVLDSISLDGLFRAESSPTKYDEDESPGLMVKFDRQAVIVKFELYENKEITLTGKLNDDNETEFKGILVINP